MASESRQREQRPLTVAFFAMFPEDNVATATFCSWPVEHGEQLGIKGRMLVPSSPGLHARMHSPGRLRRVRMAVYWYLLVLPRRLAQLRWARRADVAFVQRGLLHPKSRPLLESLLARSGTPIVYHLDDALWVLKPEGYRRRVRLARAVVTGTEAVAAYARGLGARVEIVEYPVEAERYPVREHRERDEPVRIGWTGARPEEYLPPALPGILAACRSTGARLKIVSGDRRPELGAIDEFLDWEPWTPERRFDALADADIGVAPLADSELHRGKEPFKLKEYMAWGLPVVASPVGHVPELMRDGEEGYFAPSAEDWAPLLEKLIGDPALRARMGAAGRDRVAASYRYEAQMELLVAVLAAARAST